MKKIVLILILLLLCYTSGCVHHNKQISYNEQKIERIDLPEGTKFVGITFQSSTLFYTYRPRKDNESIEEYTIQSEFDKKFIIVEH